MPLNKEQKSEIVDLLKEKFENYTNVYLTDTESLTVDQFATLRRACFDKEVEMKIAKNTLIKRAIESLQEERYNGALDSLKGVTALMFSNSPKDPAVILSDFRDGNPGDRPVLKAAVIGEEFYEGDDQLSVLKSIKSREELIGEVIGLLQSPISAVLGALENKENATGKQEEAEAATEAAPAEATAAPAADATEEKTDDAPEAKAEDASAEDAAPEAKAEDAPTEEAAPEAKAEDAEDKSEGEDETKPEDA